MNRTILQIPLDKQLKSNAEKIALLQGFSSLQEIVRVFLAQLALKKVEITLQEPVALSNKNERRYEKITNDFESGANIYSAKNTKDLIAKLNAD